MTMKSMNIRAKVLKVLMLLSRTSLGRPLCFQTISAMYGVSPLQNCHGAGISLTRAFMK